VLNLKHSQQPSFSIERNSNLLVEENPNYDRSIPSMMLEVLSFSKMEEKRNKRFLLCFFSI
jgi:hypothetical protein